MRRMRALVRASIVERLKRMRLKWLEYVYIRPKVGFHVITLVTWDELAALEAGDLAEFNGCQAVLKELYEAQVRARGAPEHPVNIDFDGLALVPASRART